ncbi:MAG: metal ABC transporter permease [Anaerolineae bacterium]|nr:metal ABC transporter permease [Anaerolineae bacterium]
MDFLLAPLVYPFMVRALIASIIVGIVCGVVGSYVVLRGMAFLGDALAHSILPGVAIGYLLGKGAKGPIFWGAIVAAILASLGIGALSKQTKLREDASIGIIFAGMLALGIAIISSVRNYAVDLAHFLFGNVLAVSWGDLALIAGLGAAVIITVMAFYKEFMVMAFDPILASTLRIKADLLNYIFLAMISVTVVVSLQTVGVALAVALLITPAATAYLLANRLPAMMALSAAIGVVSGIIGLYLSYYLGVASGASIVLVATVFFLLAFVFSRKRRP